MALTAMVEQDGEYLKLGLLEEEARLFYDVSGNQTLLQTDDSGGTLVDRLTVSNAGLGTWAGAWTVTGAMISNGNLTMSDDILLGLGTGNTARLSWDTTDANANALLLQMPAGGATDVPVLAIGQSIESVDLGLFNGVVDPTIAIFGIGAVATGSRLRVYKARGTIAAPTAVTTGDDLFQISAYAAVAAGEYRESVRILLDSMGTIATTRGPGRISLQVATDAAPDALTERVEITASGLITLTPGTDVVIANATGVIVGHTAQVAAGAVTSEVQMHGTAPADSSILLAAWSVDTAAPRIYFAKSRGALGTLGTTIETGDLLGQILAYGDDSADFNSNGNASCEIRFVSTGTIAADRIPGQILLRTATNAAPSVLTTAVTIGADQAVTLAGNITVNGDIYYGADGKGFYASNTDGHITKLGARDSGVGLVELAQLTGAADPYIRIGRDDTGVATNAVVDMLVLQAGAGTNNEAASFGLGLAVNLGNAASEVQKRGYLNWVLSDATDASEDVRLDIGLMEAGALNLVAQISSTGVLDVDASSGLGAATVGLFDDYDDAIILRQGISERKLEVLEKIGIVRRKDSGSGWMLGVQRMLYLLAGGIYQTRQLIDDRVEQLEQTLAVKAARIQELEGRLEAAGIR